MLADLFFNEEIDINDYNDTNTPISYPSSMIKPPSCRNEYGFVGLENQ